MTRNNYDLKFKDLKVWESVYRMVRNYYERKF